MTEARVPAWKKKGSRFYIPLWKRPLRFLQNKFWRFKYPNYWKCLFLYGWKQWLPSNPKVGDRAGAESGVGGTISKITDDYIEIRGIFVYASGDDERPPRSDNHTENWSYRYNRKELGKLWRRPFGGRDQWDFDGKPQWDHK